MKKICIVSTIPTHPTTAGHRARIKGLVDEYRKLNLEVHFLLLETDEEPADYKELKEYFKNKLHILTKQRSWPLNSILIKTINKFRVNLLLKLGMPVCQLVDGYYPYKYHYHLLSTLRDINPDYIQVEYTFLSYILKFFPEKTRIIDTHDVFCDRNKKITDANWYSTTRNQEIMALNRADYVLAITEEDADHFKHYSTKSKIVTVGHLIEIDNNFTKGLDKQQGLKNLRIGFIGSINPVNREACDKLICSLNGEPNIEIIIAGKISSLYKNKEPLITFLESPTLGEFYDKIDILYNPTNISTGLKIKNIEALMYDKILITTSDGAQGLRDGIGNAFFCIEKDDDIKKILGNINTANISPKEFAVNKISQWKNNLKSIFEE